MNLNVVLVMEVVNRTVLILLVVIHVLVTRDILLIVMDIIVMVRIIIIILNFTFQSQCCVCSGVSLSVCHCVSVCFCLSVCVSSGNSSKPSGSNHSKQTWRKHWFKWLKLNILSIPISEVHMFSRITSYKNQEYSLHIFYRFFFEYNIQLHIALFCFLFS